MDGGRAGEAGAVAGGGDLHSLSTTRTMCAA